MGQSYFACSMGTACSRGLQRVRVHVTDTSRTASVRTAGGATLAEYVREIVEVEGMMYKSTDATLADTKADSLMGRLSSIASNSPDSCADWLMPTYNSNTTCLAFAYTDMGVLSR